MHWFNRNLMCVCDFILWHWHWNDRSELSIKTPIWKYLQEQLPYQFLIYPFVQITNIHRCILEWQISLIIILDCDDQKHQTYFWHQLTLWERVIDRKGRDEFRGFFSLLRTPIHSLEMSSRAFGGIPRQFAKAMRFQRYVVDDDPNRKACLSPKWLQRCGEIRVKRSNVFRKWTHQLNSTLVTCVLWFLVCEV